MDYIYFMTRLVLKLRRHLYITIIYGYYVRLILHYYNFVRKGGVIPEVTPCFIYIYIYFLSISLKLKLSPVLKVYTPQHFKTSLSELKHRYISCVNFGVNIWKDILVSVTNKNYANVSFITRFMVIHIFCSSTMSNLR